MVRAGIHLTINEFRVVMGALDDPVSRIAGHFLQDK
jgi:hypothetical protein